MRNGTALIGSGQLNRVVIGGGGFVTCFDSCPADGRMIIGCDTAPAQWRDLAGGAAARWKECINATNAAAAGLDWRALINAYGNGVPGAAGVAIAPSNSAVMVIATLGRLLRTTDSWQTFSICNLAPQSMNSNDGYCRWWNPRIAIHPTDPLTFIAGMQAGGAYYSTNGGTTMTSTGVAVGVTFSGSYPSNLVAFDPGAPANVYITKNGDGIYRSTTGASGTFTLVSGGPTTQSAINVAANGTVFVCEAGSGNVWKLARGSSTWAQTATQPTGGANTITSDPANSNHLFVAQAASGHMSWSYDAGATWLHMDNSKIDATANGLTWLEQGVVYTGQAAFNAFDGKVYVVHGRGIIRGTPVASGGTSASLWTWEEYSLGNEMLGVLGFFSQPGVEIIARVYDKTMVRPHNLRSADSRPIVPGQVTDTGAVTHAFSIDYEPGNPQHLISLCDYGGYYNGYNNNGGQGFWPNFVSTPHPDNSHYWLGYGSRTGSFVNGAVVTGGTSGATGTLMEDARYAATTSGSLIFTSVTGTFVDGETITGAGGGSATVSGSQYIPSPIGGLFCRTGPTQFIWCPGNNGRVVRTTDFGATWIDLTIGGVTPVYGQNSSQWLDRRNFTSDKEQPGHVAFIGRNEGNPTPALPLAGVWHSTDHGATWTKKFTGTLENVASSEQFWGCRLSYVPGHAGKLIYSEGFTVNNPLITSDDDGATWTRLGASYTVQGISDFSFGKGLPGSSWPALFFLGTVNGSTGVWVTYDMFATVPVAVATGTNAWFWDYGAVGGDWNVLGRVWVCLAGGGGMAYYDVKDVRALT